jgi:hypothetical protein
MPITGKSFGEMINFYRKQIAANAARLVELKSTRQSLVSDNGFPAISPMSGPKLEADR